MPSENSPASHLTVTNVTIETTKLAKELKRSLTLQGHRTSLSLEPEFWAALQDEAKKHRLSLAQLVQRIDADRGSRNLSSAVRVFLLKQLQQPPETASLG